MVSRLPTRTNVLLMTGQLRSSSGFSPHSAPCTRLRTIPTLAGPSIRLICLLRCSTLAISLDLSPRVDVEGCSHMSEVECALVCQDVTPPGHSMVSSVIRGQRHLFACDVRRCARGVTSPLLCPVALPVSAVWYNLTRRYAFLGASCSHHSRRVNLN